MAEFGAKTAFNRSLVFSEREVLLELLPYLKRTLNLVDAEVFTVEEARAKGTAFNQAIVEVAEPGSPAIEFRNV